MGTLSTETSYLYALPSFFEGMSHTLDIGNISVTFNESSTPEEADRKAIGNDWMAVGKDISISIYNYDKKNESSN